MRDAGLKIDGLIQAHKDQIKCLEQLKQSLTNTKHDNSHGRPDISLTPADVIVLKRMYAKAVTENVDQFEFKGHVLNTQYAKYMIEYALTQFDDTRR